MAVRRLGGVLAREILPVAGVALFGWDAWELILLYWIETWFIGADAFMRMTIAEGEPDPASGEPRIDPSSRGCQLVGFVLVFGFQAWMTGGIVLTGLPRMLGSSASIEAPLAFGAAVLVSAIAQWWEHRRFMASDEYLRVSLLSQGRAPLTRLMVIWVAVFAGTFIGSFFPGLSRSVAVILGKTVADVMAEYQLGVFAPDKPKRASGSPAA